MNTQNTETFEDGLKFSTQKINMNFRIKVKGAVEGRRLNTLVGVSGLVNLIEDVDLINKLLTKAFDSPCYSITCKLRRGIKITFYSK